MRVCVCACVYVYVYMCACVRACVCIYETGCIWYFFAKLKYLLLNLLVCLQYSPR